MNAPYHPIQTAADVMAMVDQSEMPERRKRDLLVGDQPGLPDDRLPARRPEAGRAGAAGQTRCRPAGCARHLAEDLRQHPQPLRGSDGMGGGYRPPSRGRRQEDPAWAPLAAAIAGDKRLANGLAAFMNWCA